MSFVDTVRQLREHLQSDEARTKRAARRDIRERRIYAQVRDAIEDIKQGENGLFTNRCADLWNIHRKESTRKIEGHPGAAAAMYVSEAFGEFNIHGTLRARYSGLQREAGKGGHGITEGTILVDIELKPVHGMTQVVEVPVYVQAGYMQTPGIMYHQGSPMVIAQSAIDEIMSAAKYGDKIDADRRHLFAPPKVETRKASLEREAAPKRLPTAKDQANARQWLIHNHPEAADYWQSQPPGTDFVAVLLQNLRNHGEGENLAQWGLEDFAPHWDDTDEFNQEGSVDAQAAPAAMPQKQMVQNMRPQEMARQNQGEQMRQMEEQKARQRRQQMTGPMPGKVVPIVQGRPVAAGQITAGRMARLACEVCIATNEAQTEGYKLPEGSRVFVVATTDEGAVHVKHESGLEVIVDPANLN